MNIELIIGFIAATAILIAIPGPVVTLLVATGARYGKRAALEAVAGSTLAVAIHIMIVGLGMSPLLAFIGEWLTWLKWIGALYLIWLGISSWRDSRQPTNISEPSRLPRSFKRGFLIGITNPKTLLFYAAFFPQFIDPTLSTTVQLSIMCPLFVVITGVIDSSYALGASNAKKWLTHPKAKRITDCISGTLLIAAGVGLAATKRT